jgi:hypothetical protein
MDNVRNIIFVQVPVTCDGRSVYRSWKVWDITGQFFMGNRNGTDLLGDLSVRGRMWATFFWLRTGGHKTVKNIMSSRKMRNLFTTEPLFSRKLCFMQLKKEVAKEVILSNFKILSMAWGGGTKENSDKPYLAFPNGEGRGWARCLPYTSHKMVMQLTCIQGYPVRTVTQGLAITTQFTVIFLSHLRQIVRWHLQTAHCRPLNLYSQSSS